jgi:hypothetical protein
VQDRLSEERVAFGRHLATSDIAIASMDAALVSGTMLETIPACEPKNAALGSQRHDR